jgi:hypothetical protein
MVAVVTCEIVGAIVATTIVVVWVGTGVEKAEVRNVVAVVKAAG